MSAASSKPLTRPTFRIGDPCGRRYKTRRNNTAGRFAAVQVGNKPASATLTRLDQDSLMKASTAISRMSVESKMSCELSRVHRCLAASATVLAAVMFGSAPAALAQSGANFYAGKQITLLCGAAVGGGYDAHA